MVAHICGEHITFSSGLCLNAFSQRIWEAFQKQPGFLQAEHHRVPRGPIKAAVSSAALPCRRGWDPKTRPRSWRGRRNVSCPVPAGRAAAALPRGSAFQKMENGAGAGGEKLRSPELPWVRGRRMCLAGEQLQHAAQHSWLAVCLKTDRNI